jgi:hypothetical protein
MNSKSIEILESGKIKFKKDEKVDLSAFVESSIMDANISRLEGIPSKEEIVIDGSSNNYRIEASTNCSSITRIVELVSSINTIDVQTIVLPMSKKRASKLEDNDIVAWLGRSSTFAAVYSKLENSWNELNEDDNSSFTNVMYIPKIYIFLEDKKGKLRKKPIMVNLMIVALPSIHKAKDGIEAMDNIEYTNRIINDSFDACIRCGCKSIVIDPFSMTALQKDVHYTSRYWHGKTETQRIIENIRNITFSIDNDDLYVIFCKNK